MAFLLSVTAFAAAVIAVAFFLAVLVWLVAVLAYSLRSDVEAEVLHSTASTFFTAAIAFFSASTVAPSAT